METKTHIVLSEMPRKNAFSVPDGYFEELPTAVLLKCSGSEVKKKQFFSASKPLWWSVAACSLLLLGIWFVGPNSTPSSDSSFLALNEIFQSENHVQNYLAHHADLNIVEYELSLSDVDFSQSQEFTQDEILGYADHFDLTYEDMLNE
jgi:hypothetical protein